MILGKTNIHHRSLYRKISLVFIAALLFTCSEPEVGKPIATAIAPAEDEVGAEVLIIGNNFATATEVMFGTTSSSIVGKTDTEILTIVPPGVAVGDVQVTVNSAAGSSDPLPFKVLPTVPFNPTTHPVIDEVVAAQNVVEELLLIRGKNFSTTATVKFGAVEAQIFTSTSKVIAVKIPKSLSPASYSLKVRNAIGTSEGKPFTVTETMPPPPSGLTLTNGVPVAPLPASGYVPPISNQWTNTTAPSEKIQLNDETNGKLSAFLAGQSFPDQPNGSYDKAANWIEFTINGIRYAGMWTVPTEKNDALGEYCMSHLVLISAQSGRQLILQVKNLNCP